MLTWRGSQILLILHWLYFTKSLLFYPSFELSRSVFALTGAHITHFDPRWRGNKAGFVRFIPALHGIETLSPFFCLPPFFFCLAELQFREPFPARLHVFLGGFLRRGWFQHKIGIGVTGTRWYFTLEPAQTWAFQEENPRRVCAGPCRESRAQDRRWAAASRLSRFGVHPQNMINVGFLRWIFSGAHHYHFIVTEVV